MKVLIIGAGISALAAYNLADKVGDNPTLLISKKELSKIKNQKYIFNQHLDNLINNYDLFVISPGVYFDDKRLLVLKQNNKKVISEIEYAYLNLKTKPFIISVTGTNGKTTVVEGVYQILKELNYRVFKGGNIGIPFSDIVLELKDNDYLILEVSNFQLDNIESFKPDIAIITNITPNHLDHMRNMEHYVKSKQNIYKNMNKNDVLIYHDDIKDYINYQGKTKVIETKINHFETNKEFINAVLKILNIKNYEKNLINYSGVKYRFQKINDYIYHDGKSTTPESVINAIKSINNNKNLVLIFGGKNKNLSFDKVLKEDIKKYIVYGELAKEIDTEIVVKVNTLKDAIEYFSDIKDEKTVLLYSPGCASFDQYNNYIERCKEFDRLIKEKGYV